MDSVEEPSHLNRDRIFDELKPTFKQMVLMKPSGPWQKVRIQLQINLESMGPKFERKGFFESYIRSRRWNILGPNVWLKESDGTKQRVTAKVRITESMNGDGSHVKLEEVIQIGLPSHPSEDCSILSLRLLPYQVFVDSEMTARHIDVARDLTEHSQTVVPFASNMEKESHHSPASMLFNIKKITKRDQFQEPILFDSLVHYRVSFPEFVEMKNGGYEYIIWQAPMLYTNCMELIQKDGINKNILIDSIATEWAAKGGIDKRTADLMRTFKPIYYERLSDTTPFSDDYSYLLTNNNSNYLITKRLLGPADEVGNKFNLGVMMVVLLFNIRFIWKLLFSNTKINRSTNEKKKK